jgi:hypothetical protein
MDVRPGGKWRSDGVGADGKSFSRRRRISRSRSPAPLVHTWTGSYNPGLKTTVLRWELEPTDVHGLHHQRSQKSGHRHAGKVRSTGRLRRRSRSGGQPRRRLEARPRLAPGLRGERRNRRHAGRATTFRIVPTVTMFMFADQLAGVRSRCRLAVSIPRRLKPDSFSALVSSQ